MTNVDGSELDRMLLIYISKGRSIWKMQKSETQATMSRGKKDFTEARAGATSGSWATPQSHLLAALPALSDSSPTKDLGECISFCQDLSDLAEPSGCPLDPDVSRIL